MNNPSSRNHHKINITTKINTPRYRYSSTHQSPLPDAHTQHSRCNQKPTRRRKPSPIKIQTLLQPTHRNNHKTSPRHKQDQNSPKKKTQKNRGKRTAKSRARKTKRRTSNPVRSSELSRLFYRRPSPAVHDHSDASEKNQATSGLF